MTPTPCPHCGRPQTYKQAQHAAVCPANPDNHATYRAALEDPARPGVLRIQPEYEAARGELWSGTFLERTWRCGWGDVAAHYGLAPREAEPRKPINWLHKTLEREGPAMDAEMERNRRIVRDADGIGLPVLRVREVAHGGKVYEYCQIR